MSARKEIALTGYRFTATATTIALKGYRFSDTVSGQK
jgi:hypothetical protein